MSPLMGLILTSMASTSISLESLYTTILVTSLASNSFSLECLYTTPSTSFSSLPSIVTCECDGEEGWELWEWSSLPSDHFTEDVMLPSSLTEVVLTTCSRLQLNLTTIPLSPPSISVMEVEELEVLLSPSTKSQINISLENVTRAEYVLLPHNQAPQDFYMFLAIGLGGLLVLVLVVFFLLALWCRGRGRGEEEDTKKVARAESWRYESSIYVNPPNRQKPVYVAPPLPPPGLDSAPGLDSTPSTWSRARTGAESASSTPLLRTKYNLRGVDLVRTSLPAPPSAQELGRPPYPNPPSVGPPFPSPLSSQDLPVSHTRREMGREGQIANQLNRSDSEEEQCEAQNSSTLPHR